MTLFRNFNLCRILSILLLFAELFSQIQLLYACDSMADKPKHVCCCGERSSAVCPMTAGCAMNAQIEKTACCEVSYDILNDAGMMNAVTTVDCLTLLLNCPQPPPDIGAAPFIPAHLPILSQLPPAADQSRIFNRDKETYLLTRRLRL